MACGLPIDPASICAELKPEVNRINNHVLGSFKICDHTFLDNKYLMAKNAPAGPCACHNRNCRTAVFREDTTCIVCMSASCFPFSPQRAERRQLPPEKHADFQQQMVLFPVMLRRFSLRWAVNEQVQGFSEKRMKQLITNVSSLELDYAVYDVSYCLSTWQQSTRRRRFIFWHKAEGNRGARVCQRFLEIFEETQELIAAEDKISVRQYMFPNSHPHIIDPLFPANP